RGIGCRRTVSPSATAEERSRSWRVSGGEGDFGADDSNSLGARNNFARARTPARELEASLALGLGSIRSRSAAGVDAAAGRPAGLAGGRLLGCAGSRGTHLPRRYLRNNCV